MAPRIYFDERFDRVARQTPGGTLKFFGKAKLLHGNELQLDMSVTKAGIVTVKALDCLFVSPSLDGKDGPLRKEFETSNQDLSLGQFLQDFGSEIARTAVQFAISFYEMEKIWRDRHEGVISGIQMVELDPAQCKYFFTIAKSFYGPLSAGSSPADNWIIEPSISSEITSFGKYMAMFSKSDGNMHRLGWREAEYVSGFSHSELITKGYAPMGGGHIELEGGHLSLHLRSPEYYYPSFDKVVEAAQKILDGARSLNPIRTVLLEGHTTLEFKIS